MGDTNYRRPNGAAENIGHNVAQQQAKGARTVVAVEPPADAAGASAAATAAICVLRDAVSSRRGAAWDRAKDNEREIAGEAYDAAKAAAEAGMPETQIAEALGVNRLTVRRALGKN